MSAFTRIGGPASSPRRPLFGLGVGMLISLLGLVPAGAGEGAFRLGPEDRVRVRVYEWRASQDVVFEWKALNEEFTVSASGDLSLPLAGDIAASGQAPDDVARLIGQRLQMRMHLADPPDVSVNVTQYRPFFVAGDVAHPGSYPYRPGLTVLQAVAIAGGTPRPGDLGLTRLGREAIDGEGELVQLGLQADTLSVRRARLQAELDGAESFDASAFAVRAADDPAFARVVQNETKIFDARRTALLTQSAALADLKTFLTKETESLTAQLATLDTQMELINKELTGVSSLVEKGMAIAPRQLALERSVAQITGDRLNMQTSMLRVEAELSRADIALIELRNGRLTEGSLELRDVQIKLDEVASRTETRKRLLFETQFTAPRIIKGRIRRAALRPTYRILREDNGSTTEAPADEQTLVAPGDAVKVTMPLPDDETPGGELAQQSPPGTNAGSVQ